MTEAPDHSPQAVAEHLAHVFHEKGWLYQEHAVREVRRHFGDAFIYRNKNGNPAIDKKVLAAFRELTPDAAWSRSDFRWVRRRSGDSESRSID